MIDRNQIPSSWKVVKLVEVCSYSKGKKPVSLSTEKNSKNNIPYINIKAFEKGIFDEYADGEKCNLCEDGDLLMVWDGARCGYVGKAKKGAVGSTLMKIEGKECLHKEYLFNFLQSKFPILNTKPKGVGIPHIEPTLLWNFDFPLPPLSEQHRLVSKIEELFSELDKGIESLKTAQQQLKVYRQAVLKWAFEGRLTEEWRIKNGKLKIKNADELLNEIKSAREKKAKEQGKKLKPISSLTDEELGDLYELPEGWRWIKIVETVFNTADDIVDGPFGSNLKNSDYVDGSPIPVISISNIEEGFNKKIRYITKEKFETIKRSAVYPGDIIVAKIGSTYGKTGIYPDWMPVGVIPANLLRVRPSNHFSKKLLVHYLKSRGFKIR